MQACIGLDEIYIILGRFAAGSPWTLHWIWGSQHTRRTWFFHLYNDLSLLWGLALKGKIERRPNGETPLSFKNSGRVHRCRNIGFWLLRTDKGMNQYTTSSHEINPDSHNKIYTYVYSNLFKIWPIFWMRVSTLNPEVLPVFLSRSSQLRNTATVLIHTYQFTQRSHRLC